MSRQLEDNYLYYSFFDLKWWKKHVDKDCEYDDLFSFYGKVQDDPDSCYKMKFTWYYEDNIKKKYTIKNINNNGIFWIEFCEAIISNDDDY